MSCNAHLALHFERYRGELLAYLRTRVATADIAEDLLQETFLRLLQRANLAEVDNPKAYVKTTARNVLADHHRLKSAQFHRSGVEFDDQQHPDDRSSPGRLLQSREQLERLTAALEGLSINVRRAFLLSRMYGHTYAEIGEMIGLSPRTVEKHVAKALATCYATVHEVEAVGAGPSSGVIADR